MEPEDFNEEDLETFDPDEDTPELDWDESEALSVARELGITSGL